MSVFTLSLTLLVIVPGIFGLAPLQFQPSDSQQRPFGMDDIKVPVQLGVMSRCPDALLCESLFDQVLKKVSDKVDFSLVYLGTLDSSEPNGVTCKHGPDECAGNVQQLCVKKYSDFSRWWEFIHCQNYQGIPQIGSSGLALKCARAAKIDWESEGAGECAGLDGSGTGSEGSGLLAKSVQLSHEMNIEKSCTVIINNKHVCIHDGTWKECDEGHNVNDFVRQINAAYNDLNSRE